ncbi:MAG: hypothetical protein U0791_04320 [Gemmataceae bacterium]
MTLALTLSLPVKLASALKRKRSNAVSPFEVLAIEAPPPSPMSEPIDEWNADCSGQPSIAAFRFA